MFGYVEHDVDKIIALAKELPGDYGWLGIEQSKILWFAQRGLIFSLAIRGEELEPFMIDYYRTQAERRPDGRFDR